MRSISDEFQSELHSGTLKWVTDAVKDRTNNLILCFRDGYVNVYYKSHSLFKITQHQRGYRLSLPSATPDIRSPWRLQNPG